MLHRVAITGSLASGKSTICRFFEEWGAYVVQADQILHHEFSVSTELGRQISGLFGDEILEGKEIQRKKILEAVVRTPELLIELERICHPFVNSEIVRRYAKACEVKKFPLFVAEVPLLFESKWSMQSWFDTIVVVVADREQSKLRFLRSGGTREQFDFLEERQMPSAEKMKRAQYALANNGSRAELQTKAYALYKTLTTLKPPKIS